MNKKMGAYINYFLSDCYPYLLYNRSVPNNASCFLLLWSEPLKDKLTNGYFPELWKITEVNAMKVAFF